MNLIAIDQSIAATLAAIHTTSVSRAVLLEPANFNRRQAHALGDQIIGLQQFLHSLQEQRAEAVVEAA